MTPPNLLFARPSLFDVLQAQEGEARSAVGGLEAGRVLSTPASDLVDDVMSRFEVHCPVLRLDEKYTPGATDAQIDIIGDFSRVTFGSGRHYVSGTSIALHVPFDGDGQIFLWQPQTWSLNPPHGIVHDQELILRVSVPADALNMSAIKQELDGQLNRVAQQLDTARNQVEVFNVRLRSVIDGLVNQRREKVLRDRQLEEFLEVPVGRRSDPTPILAVDLPRKVPERRPVEVAAPFTPEPAITLADFEAIVQAIGSFGLATERFPQTFGPMHEPVLRDLLLVVLNNQFGPAVGEMFSRQGKTDIVILHDNGPVLIAECKIWTGAEKFSEAIDQLLGYLVWRDTKAALVLFVKNKDVTAVIDKATELLEQHDRYKRASQPLGDHPLVVLHHPDDRAREIEVALIAIAVPTERAAQD